MYVIHFEDMSAMLACVSKNSGSSPSPHIPPNVISAFDTNDFCMDFLAHFAYIRQADNIYLAVANKQPRRDVHISIVELTVRCIIVFHLVPLLRSISPSQLIRWQSAKRVSNSILYPLLPT